MLTFLSHPKIRRLKECTIPNLCVKLLEVLHALSDLCFLPAPCMLPWICYCFYLVYEIYSYVLSRWRKDDTVNFLPWRILFHKLKPSFLRQVGGKRGKKVKAGWGKCSVADLCSSSRSNNCHSVRFNDLNTALKNRFGSCFRGCNDWEYIAAG